MKCIYLNAQNLGNIIAWNTVTGTHIHILLTNIDYNAHNTLREPQDKIKMNTIQVYVSIQFKESNVYYTMQCKYIAYEQSIMHKHNVQNKMHYIEYDANLKINMIYRKAGQISIAAKSQSCDFFKQP